MAGIPDDPIVVLDHGGGTVKVGFAGEAAPRVVAPNAVARLRKQTRVLVAEQTTDAVRDLSQLVWQRPMERGYCTDWGAAGRVWSHVLGPAPGGVGVGDAATGAAGARLCVTQPPHTPPSIAERTLEAAFEEWRFDGVATVLPAQGVAAAWARDNPGTSLASPTNRCGVVIDSGFSFSHVVPFYRGQPVLRGIVRVPVGGKLLTNLLKETVSYRAWNIMDDFALADRIKERVCKVALNFDDELRAADPRVRRKARLAAEEAGASHEEQAAVLAQGDLTKHFVLPDAVSVKRGYVVGSDEDPAAREADSAEASGDAAPAADADAAAAAAATSAAGAGDAGDDGPELQTLPLNGERIAIPEALFSPADIGVRHAGVVEAVAQALSRCPERMRGPMMSSVVLAGGNAVMEGFEERFTRDLRSVLPSEFPLSVSTVREPVVAAWQGCSMMAHDLTYESHAAYMEEGAARLVERMLPSAEPES